MRHRTLTLFFVFISIFLSLGAWIAVHEAIHGAIYHVYGSSYHYGYKDFIFFTTGTCNTAICNELQAWNELLGYSMGALIVIAWIFVLVDFILKIEISHFRASIHPIKQFKEMFD